MRKTTDEDENSSGDVVRWTISFEIDVEQEARSLKNEADSEEMMQREQPRVCGIN